MGSERNILNSYCGGGTYSLRSVLEDHGYTRIDENGFYIAKVDDDGSLRIWRTMGDCDPDEGYIGCIPVYATKNWSPDDKYTGPLNEKIQELFDALKKKEESKKKEKEE